MTDREVRILIAHRMEQLNLNRTSFGEMCHLSRQTIGDATSGRRPPSKRILKQLGLRRVKTLTYEPADQQTAAEIAEILARTGNG